MGEMKFKKGNGACPQVSATLTFKDHWGSLKARLGINRYNYRIPPGLYRIGKPDHISPLLVTANYKLTFDLLRRELGAVEAWILVLNTEGINVWCAAGGGLFNTGEVVERVKKHCLERVVSHKTLILPQLAAPGVAAHQVQKETGFKVVYGPLRAADIPRFLEKGMKATEEMRRVRFTLLERLILTPIELVHGAKYLPLFFLLLVAWRALSPGGTGFFPLLRDTFFNFLPFLAAFLTGTVGTALFLPYLPFRSFYLKGVILGALLSAAIIFRHPFFLLPGRGLVLGGTALLLTGVVSYLALNFTGSTPYTSISGVKKETRYALPATLITLLSGVIFLAADSLYTFIR